MTNLNVSGATSPNPAATPASFWTPERKKMANTAVVVTAIVLIALGVGCTNQEAL